VDSGVSAELLTLVETVLRRENPYVKAYMSIAEQLREEKARRPANRPLEDVYIAFVSNINHQLRNYNLPESRNDIAALFIGDDSPFPVDLQLRPRAVAAPAPPAVPASLADPAQLGEHGSPAAAACAPPRSH